ncbi:sigma-70 family RNA polymerase sigma factor [Streptomyces sp. PKU-MA01144]|uniref:sigma-70 family RNA polymerase sigma factor n=1 Tax=Streptomyces sp. PKU-MA01144 TaxID=2729138 RepID=UPI00147E07EE|nr:sigma-70 family RNA polymerase sigma factor [Streptomyces sp. PKU-MA01144]NNJ07404.1 sigma-70 family RNA polymerase sigma factor [Streptomyces sp. PKU-MA01144]
MSSEREAAVIMAAQAGDQHAQDRLVAEYLPLVYNIVGRAMNGHADVDDVVQETMLRVLGGLDGLRSPDSFRSWLVAITMNQIRGHWRERRTGAIPGAGGLEEAYDVVDPGADFVDLTITRLGLSGQRRETAEATRWLDEDDRALLSLWWLEAAGELSREEVAAALELSPQHTAVRVQRMKAQLETARVVVRALAAEPRCVLLEPIVASWDGLPSALWRKRIARHARGCTVCAGHWSGLVPAEGLLVGLALVPVAASAAAFAPHTLHMTDTAATAATASFGSAAHPGGAPADGHAQGAPYASHAPGAGGAGAGGPSGDPAGSGEAAGAGSARTQARLDRARRRRRTTAVAAAVAALVAAGGTAHLLLGPDESEEPASTVAAPAATERPTPSPSTTASASPSPSASASGSVSASPSPSVSASPSTVKPKPKPSTAKPRPTPTREAPAPEPELPSGDAEQVVALVNAERAKAGCGPVRSNDKLETAARRHSEDMAARGYFDHTSPDGTDPGDRITAAGYQWSTYGENIARGQQSPSSVMTSWMNSPGHRANILNCSFKELGVGIHDGSGGPWWTQAFGTSR